MTSPLGMPTAPAGWDPPLPDPAARRAQAVGQGSLVAVGLGAVVLAARTVSLHAPPCPFRLFTGVPCPGCGLTRVADALVHGRFEQVLRLDVAGALLLVVLGVVATVHLVRVVVQHRPPPAWMRWWAVPGVLIGLLAIHWATTIVTGGFTTT